MEKEINKQNDEVVESTQSAAAPEAVKSDTVNINLGLILECAFYLVGIVCLIIAIKWYGKDLDSYSENPFRFYEESYVGGDAYNYIISAARSSAVVGKSIFWAILASACFICGRLSAISRVKKCK